jgi:hypothetical protein
MKKLYPFIGVGFLFCSLLALDFSYIDNDRDHIIAILISLIVFLVFLLINIEYFRVAVKSKKLFLVTIVPLILIPLLLFLICLFNSKSGIIDFSLGNFLFSFINLALTFLLLYYLLVAIYGICCFKKINKNIRFNILKLCFSVIIMTIVMFAEIIIVSTMIIH